MSGEAVGLKMTKQDLKQNFVCEEVLYLYGGQDDDSLIYYNSGTEEQIRVSRYFGENLVLSGVCVTGENGVIFTYYSVFFVTHLFKVCNPL